MPSFLLKELYMRIDKYISGCGYASRKDVKKLIKQGLVFIDGEVCKKPEEQTDENSIVEVDGERLIYREFVYLMLNKPQGCVSAVYDKKYPVVTEFVPDLIAQEHVLSNGEQGDQRQLLVDDDDAQRLAVALILELAELSLIVDLTGVASRGISAGQHVHQRGFARAVFAQQSHDLAGAKLKVNIVQRFHAWEALADAPHGNNGFVHSLTHLSLIPAGILRMLHRFAP